MRGSQLQDLSDAIRKALKNSMSPMSAKDIAKKLGFPRTEVNSVLYSMLGREFKIFDTVPPTWDLLNESSRTATGGTLTRFKQIDQEIHVDAPGGDWKMKVLVAQMSVNDPVAIVESYGPKARLITVSSAVSRSSSAAAEIPESCLAVASAMLAWEIAESLRSEGVGRVDFSNLLRDIYVSVGAHSRRSLDELSE